MPEAVIVATARSPIGRAMKGSLKDMRPDDLSAQVLTDLMSKVPQITPDHIDDLIMGCGQPAGESGHNIGRATAVLMGWNQVPGVTVNRYCSSSLMTIRMAAHAIKAGEGDCFVAAGVETVSRFIYGMADGPHNPLFADAEARTATLAEGNEADWAPHDNLPDVYIAMGQTAENVAEYKQVSREAQDEFAARSQNLSEQSLDEGYWADEITPITLPDGTVVKDDDGIRRGTTAEKLSGLQPVFRPGGTVTAGNACPLNDGAAGVVVMSDTLAKELGLTPLARIVSSGVSGLNPEIMGLGPVEAIKQALGRANMSIDDIDLVEINEAFAAVVLSWAQVYNADMSKVNVNGGAMAMGHPVGSTGARLIIRDRHELERQDKTTALITMCCGANVGTGTIIERI